MRSVGKRGLLAAATVAATSAAMVLVGAVSAGAAPAGDTGVLRTVTSDASVGFPAGQQTGTPSGIQNNERPPGEPDESNNSAKIATPNGVSATGVPVVSAT